jgi:hypothetical protein
MDTDRLLRIALIDCHEANFRLAFVRWVSFGHPTGHGGMTILAI